MIASIEAFLCSIIWVSKSFRMTKVAVTFGFGRQRTAAPIDFVFYSRRSKTPHNMNIYKWRRRWFVLISHHVSRYVYFWLFGRSASLDRESEMAHGFECFARISIFCCCINKKGRFSSRRARVCVVNFHILFQSKRRHTKKLWNWPQTMWSIYDMKNNKKNV